MKQDRACDVLRHSLTTLLDLSYGRATLELAGHRSDTRDSPRPHHNRGELRTASVWCSTGSRSAADAQHIAAEFVSRFEFDRPGLPSIALTTDTSMLTAIGNDYGFDKLFTRQLEANSKSGDIFIGISTSGNSANILNAFEKAKILGVSSVALCGAQGKVLHCSDYQLSVPSSKTPRIQESHILIGHIICGLVENTLFGSSESKVIK